MKIVESLPQASNPTDIDKAITHLEAATRTLNWEPVQIALYLLLKDREKNNPAIDVLEEVFNYRGGAINALEDDYLMERVARILRDAGRI